MKVLAIILPPLAFWAIGRPWASLMSVLLQFTLIGWIPASIWACRAVEQAEAEWKLQQAYAERNPASAVSGPWT